LCLPPACLLKGCAVCSAQAEKFQELAEWQPVGRMGRPEEIAALVLYLVSDESSFVTGAAYPIDGGRSSL
jgi:NAD(P)-dependent dehydrogenase (short-subunit alcohol dehydrogenase family)